MADTPLPTTTLDPGPRLSRAALLRARKALDGERGRLRARDAAAALGVSEAELVAAEPDAVRLRPIWHEIVAALHEAGPLMALTRNETIVHEKTGVYERASGGPQIGLTLGDDIDLRLFYRRWAFGFASGFDAADAKPNLQFFDRHGVAVHKVYAVDGTDRTAFAAIAARFADPEAGPDITIEPAADRPAVPDDAEIDVAGFVAAWDAMQDTHEFHDLLKRFGVERDRRQALRLAALERAEPVAAATFEALVTRAAETGQPIMVFVGNAGCIQIHTGPVRTLKTFGDWFNVLDPGFNLHVRTPELDQAWIVRKPTSDGTVTSLEVFDRRGTLVVSVFGKRKPGQPQDPAWEALVESFGRTRSAA
jgi:putative hemin transport protein